MAVAILDRRNWIFLAALVPAGLVALVWSVWPGRQGGPASPPPAAISAPTPTPQAGPAPGPVAAAPTKVQTKPVKQEPDFTVKTALQLDGPLGPGDYVWDDSGVPDGQVAIVVDVKSEIIYVYRGGDEIGRSTLIYGDDEKPTPIGVFPIIEKKADHYSKTYGGAPMPHMLRLTTDGVAIHGSRWIHPDYATHGCIGLPKKFAAILFREAKTGDYVKITRGWNPAE
jgi:lipoprotein-anchoring transpeptidase ErfK/SrfK